MDNLEIYSVGKNSNSGQVLKQYVERIERLEAEKSDISDNIRDVYAMSKAEGFDVKTIRQIIKLRKMDKSAREEQELVLKTYMLALGMEEVMSDD